MVTAGQQLLDRLLKNLEKRNYHDNGEDENAERLKALAADRKPFPQSLETPAHQLVGRPDDECAEQVESGIDKRCDQGQGA